MVLPALRAFSSSSYALSTPFWWVSASLKLHERWRGEGVVHHEQRAETTHRASQP